MGVDGRAGQVVVKIRDVQPHHVRSHAILADLHGVSVGHSREIGHALVFVHPRPIPLRT